MQLSLFEEDTIAGMTTEAIDFLRENFDGTPYLVRFSGGKDSIVTEQLAKMSGVPYVLQSTLTGIDPPEVTRFIRQHYPHCIFTIPRQSFWHLITTANPPAGTGRGIKWCCTKIKEQPSATHPIKKRVLGIRSEESSPRAKRGRINCFNDQTHYHPIFYWREWQIWEFIDTHNLPYPKLYDEGLNRIGCVICPNHTGHHGFYRDRWPKHFKCFEKYVRIWWYKRKSQGKEMWHSSHDDFLEDWYSGKFYYYKQKPNKQINSERAKQPARPVI